MIAGAHIRPSHMITLLIENQSLKENHSLKQQAHRVLRHKQISALHRFCLSLRGVWRFGIPAWMCCFSEFFYLTPVSMDVDDTVIEIHFDEYSLKIWGIYIHVEQIESQVSLTVDEALSSSSSFFELFNFDYSRLWRDLSVMNRRARYVVSEEKVKRKKPGKL